MSANLLIPLICCTAIFVVGMFVYVSNPRQVNNRRFALLSLALVLWTSFNYLSDNATSNVTVYTRLTFFAAIIAIFMLIQFIAHFPNNEHFRKSTALRVQGAFSVFLLPIIFTPAFIGRVDVANNAIYTSYLYNVFLIYVIYSLFLLVLVVRQQHKSAQTVVQQRQVYLIGLGIGLYALFALFSSVLLPLISDSWSSSQFGPVFTLFLVGLVAYAIVRHGLFDIRLIVARSLVYLGSLAFMAGAYGFVVLGMAHLVFGLDLTIMEQVFLSVATGLAGLLFPRTQHMFNKITSSIFYRDSYDSQVFLDDFNKVLVATYEVHPLLQKSSRVITDYLKPDSCAFWIREGDKGMLRTIGTGTPIRLSEKDETQIRKLLLSFKDRVIITDTLDQKHLQLQQLLHQNNISIIAKLTSSRSDEGAGYLILGPKKSGNPFNSQDIKMVEILANELVIAIQNALQYEEIQQFNQVLQAKVDEATRKLRRSNEKLKALDEAKDDFVSMASHQLRTPLTSIKGYTSMVLEGDAGKINATQRKLLEQSFISSQRMVYLIADLLNVSRLKTGKFIIEPAPVNIAELVQQEIGQLKETAAGRQLELKYDMPESFPSLMLDETKTRQVIMNFIDNAIYYTPSGGHIEVKLVETPASVEFRVVDDGIGVPKSEQPHLFTKFYRAGNARTARPDGTGLGLFMAKKVVVAQGGAVIFETEEGKGSTFGFVISKTQLAPGKVKSDLTNSVKT